jgi:hypothetical protein
LLYDGSVQIVVIDDSPSTGAPLGPIDPWTAAAISQGLAQSYSAYY